jgi:hypothetical protein
VIFTGAMNFDDDDDVVEDVQHNQTTKEYV